MVPRFAATCLFAPLALLAVAQAFAAPPAPAVGGSTGPAAAADPIVVTAHAQRELRRRIGAFVNQVTRAAGAGDIARFEGPVCPAAYGLRDELRPRVVERMRRVADAAGMRVAAPGCSPNVLVVAVPDKRVLIEELRKRGASDYFGELSASQIRALAREPGGAVSWQTMGPPINARGVELSLDPSLGIYTNRTTDPPSRLHSAAHPQYYGAIVVVEAAAIEGLSVTQLADYAAMRGFGGADPKWLQGETTETILLAIDAPPGSEVPLSLTRLDLGFLRGLYASPGDSAPSTRRATIRAAMAREMNLAAN